MVPRTRVLYVRKAPSDALSDESETRTIRQLPAFVGTKDEALEGVRGEQQVPVEVDPIGE